MSYWRLFGIGFVFCVASVAWLALGGVMSARTERYEFELQDDVAELWGRAQVQPAPSMTFQWQTERIERRSETVGGEVKMIEAVVVDTHTADMSPASTTLDTGLHLDQRRKGLMWYSLYDLDFNGVWTYKHQAAEAGALALGFTFPDPSGIYDGFHFKVDGKELAGSLKPVDGRVTATVDVTPGQVVSLEIAYKTRGQSSWAYQPSNGVGNVENLKLTTRTDFADIDFPASSLSPSSRERSGDGWILSWDFERVVTGYGMGVVMPSLIQPGELASEMSLSAPVSLLFFFVILFVLSAIRGIDIHPINYLMLAAAFFAFHLLFAYTVDHLEVEVAFALCSVVSMTLVVSYMRLVVSPRFAFFETALAQLVYLIGFSLAHFWDNYTGLMVTVLSILTLFVLMQLTGRLKWSQVLERPTLAAPAAPWPAPAAPAP